MDSEFRISYNSHVSHNVILLTSFFSVFRNIKTILHLRATQKQVVAYIRPIDYSLPIPGTECCWGVYVEMYFIF